MFSCMFSYILSLMLDIKQGTGWQKAAKQKRRIWYSAMYKQHMWNAQYPPTEIVLHSDDKNDETEKKLILDNIC